jgi:hypothetical protein
MYRYEPVKSMKDKRVAALSFGGQHAALVCMPAGGGAGAHAAKRAR